MGAQEIYLEAGIREGTINVLIIQSAGENWWLSSHTWPLQTYWKKLQSLVAWIWRSLVPSYTSKDLLVRGSKAPALIIQKNQKSYPGSEFKIRHLSINSVNCSQIFGCKQKGHNPHLLWWPETQVGCAWSAFGCRNSREKFKDMQVVLLNSAICYVSIALMHQHSAEGGLSC